MLSVVLDKDIERELDEISSFVNKSKSSVIKEALKEYIKNFRDSIEEKEIKYILDNMSDDEKSISHSKIIEIDV